MTAKTNTSTAIVTEAAVEDIESYLVAHQQKELLRFVTVGSVDDGKSTLIGRLLHDTHGVYEDQLAAVQRASGQNDMEIDFSLFTDGLAAEREQGITIDVAYRYFSTVKRKFIIADTPGHIQYTRNMATGASTANVGIILIDARYGVLQQSRRHAYIASLLGIPHLAVAVNKMDLRDYDQRVFDDIVREFREFAGRLTFTDVTFTPISALRGDNIVHRSDKTPWFKGPTMLEYLEEVPIARDRNLRDFRYPVQYVLRPNLNYRAFAGEVASGIVRKGDSVMVLPSRKLTRVQGIDTATGELDEAFAPMAVALRLEDEVDVSRGSMLVHPDSVPSVGRRFDANIVWLGERGLDTGKSYLIKHTTQQARVEVEGILSVTNLETLVEEPASKLELNDIGRVRLRCHRELFFDPYRENRSSGAFIIIDSVTNNTVAAGMVIGPAAALKERTGSTLEQGVENRSQVSAQERRERLSQSGRVVWLTGASAADQTRVAYALERCLFDEGRVASVTSSEDPLASGAPPTWWQGVEAGEALSQLALRTAASGVVGIFAGVVLPERLQGSDALGVYSLGGDAQGSTVRVDWDGQDATGAARAILRHLEALEIFDARTR